MNSLQTRLIVGGATVFALGFMIGSIAVYGFSRSSMYAEFDEALRTKVQTLAALTKETNRGVKFELTEGIEEFNRRDVPSYYQVWLDGREIARSQQLDFDELVLRTGSRTQPHFSMFQFSDGRPARQVCVTFEPRYESNGDDEEDDENEEYDDDDEYEHDDDHRGSSSRLSRPYVSGGGVGNLVAAPSTTSPSDSGVLTLTWERPKREVSIAVARDTSDIEKRLTSLRWILGSVGAAMTLLSSSVLVLVVRRGLKPIESVTQRIARIDENSLTERVPADAVPAEISPMVNRLNDLLERLDAAFHRERAFSSNLAHELRTPLAGLKSTLEVHLSRLHEPQEYEGAMRACLQICDQSQNLVENLLSLSRAEGATVPCNLEEVDVAQVLHQCWRPLAQEAAAKSLEIGFDISPVLIKTDREMLRVSCRNVLANAVSYSDQGGVISASLSSSAVTLTLVVSNTGNKLSQADAEKVFDRLWRGDAARYQTGEHFGLGLTLTKRFVESLGGHVCVDVDELFRITITLPAGTSTAMES